MRDLNAYERSLLQVLLSKDFLGRDALVKQQQHALVSEMCHGEILKFHVSSAAPPVNKVERIPVEAAAPDTDGVLIHALLHINYAGYIEELEFYKDDGSDILNFPDIGTWKVDFWDNQTNSSWSRLP